MDGIEIGTLEDDGTTLVLRRHVALPVEQVWSHVADSDRLAGWYGTYTGDPTSGAVMVTLNAESDAADPVRYDVHACERPTHLSVSTTNDYGRWALELDLAAEAGGTVVVLRQTDVDPAMLADIGPGWDWYLDRLVAALSGGEPPDLDAFERDYLTLVPAYAALLTPPAG